MTDPLRTIPDGDGRRIAAALVMAARMGAAETLPHEGDLLRLRLIERVTPPHRPPHLRLTARGIEQAHRIPGWMAVALVPRRSGPTHGREAVAADDAAARAWERATLPTLARWLEGA